MPGACGAFAVCFSMLASLPSACCMAAACQQVCCGAYAGCCSDLVVLCSSGGFFGRPDPAEDEDAYAARIWRVSQLSELVLDTSSSTFGLAVISAGPYKCCCCISHAAAAAVRPAGCSLFWLLLSAEHCPADACEMACPKQTLATCFFTTQATRSLRPSSVGFLHMAKPASEMTETWVQEMEHKRRMGGDGAAAGREHFRLQREAQQAKEQAAFEAAQNSRRILGDERARDQAWRDAVSKAGICSCLTGMPPAQPYRICTGSLFGAHRSCTGGGS